MHPWCVMIYYGYLIFFMIVFKNVTKRYGRTKVLDKIDLTIKPGEFVSIIGPSGAGKSTLIYALIGAEKISGGSIEVEGYTITDMKDKAMQYYRRRIGVVFQDYKLLKTKNVFENVAFALEVCGYEKKEIKQRVMDALATVGLTKQKNQFPHQLSGGESQRVAIARALVHDPSLIVADEPTGNLDPDTAKDLIKLLKEINKDGTTVILTTHNTNLVDYLMLRVVKLDEGKVVSDRKYSGYSG